MSSTPALELRPFGSASIGPALQAVGLPHLPLAMISDHYAVGNAALRDAIAHKIDRLLTQLEPLLAPARIDWPGAAADILALDMAFVAHQQQAFDLAWVEIQAFTSMLASFHAVHLAQRRLHALGARWLPHGPLPPWIDWRRRMAPWLAPHADTVLIEDRPFQRVTLPDFRGLEHGWGLRIHDWRELQARDGYLWAADRNSPYRHVLNRLILSDLPPDEQPGAEALLRAAHRMSWHSHPAWYDGISKGSLADVELEPHEACHWVEECPDAALGWPQPERWVAKPVGGHSGSGLLLHPSREQLAALPPGRKWLVQNRFRQVPIGQHPATGKPLFGELRCLIGLRPNAHPWVMAMILRCSVNGIATLSGRVTEAGEGMSLLYLPDGISLSAAPS
jgi:hypothetical protein